MILPGVNSCFAQYISSDNLQSFNPAVNICNTNQSIHRIEIEIGTLPVILNNLTFNTNGSSSPATDIINAKLYYYNDSNLFNLSQAILIGTFNMPWITNYTFLTPPNAQYSGMSSFSGLVPGKNYFWITYDISCGAIPGNFVAACFVDGSVNGSGSFIPTSNCQGGVSTIITAPTGLNENYYKPVSRIYPIPTNGNISIELNTDNNKSISIEFLDITGKKLKTLFEGMLRDNESALNLSLHNYTSGIYLLRSNYEGKVSMNKVIISN